MSTQINVTVDSGGLADEDKQQRRSMRWAKLEKDGKSLVYRTGLDERGKALNQQGKDPTGKPKPSTPAPVLRRDEPAAFRSDASIVPFFYATRSDPIYPNVNSATITATSGDGSKTAAAVITHLNTIRYQDAETQPAGQTFDRQLVNVETVPNTVIPGSFYERRYFKTTQTGYFYDQVERLLTWMAPLGDGTAIYVYKQLQALSRVNWTTISDFYFIPTGSNQETSSGNQSFFLDFATEVSQTELYNACEIIAFRVGYKVAEQISLPSGLQNILGCGKGYTITTAAVVSDYTPGTTDGADYIGSKRNYPLTPNEIYRWTFNEYQLNTTSGITSVYPSSYGFAYSTQAPGEGTGIFAGSVGAETDAVTPFSWVSLDMDARATVPSSAAQSSVNPNHSDFRGVMIQGKSIGEIIGNNYLAIAPHQGTLGLIQKLTNTTAPYSLSGTLPSTGYGNINSLWTKIKAGKIYVDRIDPATLPDGVIGNVNSSTNRHFIYDWKNPTFCRQQAARYGL